MPKFIKNIFEKNGGKKVTNLVLVLVLGVLLLAVSTYLSSSRNEENVPMALHTTYIAPEPHATDNIGISLSEQLAQILSLVAGAGEVRVMLTTSTTGELLVAQNHEQSTQTTNETDTAGGERSIENRQYTTSHVMVRQADGSDAPLVLQELNPRVEGAIIVAQGAGNIEVAANLTRAAATVLGIAPHQVQVLEMN